MAWVKDSPSSTRCHRPELQHADRFVVKTMSRVSEEYGSRRVQFDGDRNNQKKRREHDQTNGRRDNVECPFNAKVKHRQRRLTYLYRLQAIEFGNL